MAKNFSWIQAGPGVWITVVTDAFGGNVTLTVEVGLGEECIEPHFVVLITRNSPPTRTLGIRFRRTILSGTAETLLQEGKSWAEEMVSAILSREKMAGKTTLPENESEKSG